MPANLGKGMHYERQARRYLERQGLVLVTQNYRCRFGEIDLVMREGETVCFIEARYRHSSRFGGAVYSITPAKQRKIVKTAMHYIAQNPRLSRSPLRFDVLLIQGRPGQGRPGQGRPGQGRPGQGRPGEYEQIEWIRSAFSADDD